MSLSKFHHTQSVLDRLRDSRKNGRATFLRRRPLEHLGQATTVVNIVS